MKSFTGVVVRDFGASTGRLLYVLKFIDQTREFERLPRSSLRLLLLHLASSEVVLWASAWVARRAQNEGVCGWELCGS